MITAAAWVGAYLGLFVLAYAVQVIAVGSDPDAHRTLMRHATRLAHLPEAERDRAARRIVTWMQVAVAGLMAAILLGAITLLMLA